MLKLDRYLRSAWPEELRPLGEGEIEKEDFDRWWARHGDRLRHLDSRIAEQWVHRHWSHSPFKFLPLDHLLWQSIIMSTEEVLSTVHSEYGADPAPDFDYDVFQPRHGHYHPTSRALDQGTWDYPLLILETPAGIVSESKVELPDVRLLLIEGHQRYRYLNAKAAKGQQTGPHEVLVLSLTAPSSNLL